MISLDAARHAAETLARCRMDMTKTIETDDAWIFEPEDTRKPLDLGANQASLALRTGQPAIVTKADGRVKLYRRGLRASQCAALWERETQERREAKRTGVYPAHG